jgi:hypothetical protein
MPTRRYIGFEVEGKGFVGLRVSRLLDGRPQTRDNFYDVLKF